MPTTLNSECESRAHKLIAAGKVDHGEWSAPSVGERDQADCIGDDKSYPIISDGKVSARGVANALARAKENAPSLVKALDRLDEVIKAKLNAFDRGNYDAVLVFSLPRADAFPDLTFGSDLPKEINGQPCHYAWKEVLKVGTWRDSNGKTQEINQQRIDNLHANFQKQKALNMKPFIPPSHNERSGDRNMGFIVDSRKSKDGSLELLHQLIGDDAKLAASRNGTSIYTLSNVKAPDGTVFDEFIDHNALIPDPAITTLKDFEPAMAASRGQQPSAIYLTMASQRSIDMAKLTDEHRRRLAAALPPGIHVPDEPDNEWFTKTIEDRASQHKTAMSRAETLEQDNKNLKLSREPAKPSASEIYFASEAVKAKRDAAIKSGAITPACADAAHARFLKKPVDQAKLTLSREVEPDDHKIVTGYASLIDFYEALQGNTPTPTTGTASMAMSRENPPGAGTPEAEAKKVHDEAFEQGKKYRDEQLAARGLK